MVLLGAWSFALYLVHYFPLRVATMESGPREASNANLYDLLGMALVATALAAALYYAVEQPAERFLRPLVGGRPAGRSATPAESAHTTDALPVAEPASSDEPARQSPSQSTS